MKRILFLILAALLGLGTQARAAIEIYVNGHKYDSMQAYMASKKPAVAKTPLTQVSLDHQQEDYIRREAQKLGVNVDFSKVKTFQVNQKNSSNQALHQLYILSVENGMAGALHNFYQPQGQPDFQMTRPISPEQLQEAIARAVATSKAPKFLISGPGKVRILTMTEQGAEK